jgi:serine/threonine-protein kinase
MVKSYVMVPRKIGRYEIKAEIGRGGMATVFQAYDPRFKRGVAVKVLPREFLHDPTFRVRFEREAQTIAGLDHPAIVPVYDFGEEDGQPYLVMRFLPGGTLTERLERGALPFDEVTRIISRLAPALSEAHEQGIIHRDLKPDNILFDQRNDPFITDFGIVKLSESSGSITAGNTIIGTPAYMSPEQAQGESVIDGRSDIYALGVILFQMLTGKLPYNAKTPVGLVMKHITEPVPSILKVKPNLPSECETVIAQAMAKEPDDRYSTATALATALIESTSGKPTPQPSISGPVVAPIGPESEETQDRLAPGQDVTSTEPIVCPNCHTSNPDELSFCASCGYRLKVDCVRCHTPNRIDATHCSNCGVNLESAQAMRSELLEARRLQQIERDQALQEKEARQQQERLYRGQAGQLAVEPLGTLLKDRDEDVRRQARSSLQKIGGKRAQEILDRSKGVMGWLKGNG